MKADNLMLGLVSAGLFFASLFTYSQAKNSESLVDAPIANYTVTERIAGYVFINISGVSYMCSDTFDLHDVQILRNDSVMPCLIQRALRD